MSPPVRAGLTALGITVAVGLIVAGFRIAETDEAVTLPPEVQSITPAVGSLIRPQGHITIDLADAYTGVLSLDGVEIPEDQVQRTVELGRISFRPGPTGDMERFEVGEHRVTVEYWRRTETRADSSSFSWAFRVG